MSDVNKWKSSQEMVDLFRNIGMDPKYLFSHEIDEWDHQFPKMFLESFASKEGYLALDLGSSDKNDFLNLFEGGTGFKTVLGAKPWEWRSGLKDYTVANFYADLGRGANDRVYFDSGWIAWFPEGYSTMTLVEFYDEPKPAPNFQIEGRVYHGEKAFARLNVLDDIDIVKIPDSINRWVI
tara:strand:+ start:205 stop:744 length:540 start_codon:yes stop_codon:yes gene_type:complete